MLLFFIILLIVCVLLLLVFAFSGKQNRAKVIGFFVEDADMPPSKPYLSFQNLRQGIRPDGKAAQKPGRKGAAGKNGKSASRTVRRNPKQAYTEMALLQQKIDERRRVVDSSGHSTLYDEYFELVFETKKGETLHLVTSRAAFKEVPFNQEGALTHKKGVLIKFKYAGGLISDEYSPIQGRSDSKSPSSV